MGKAAIIRQHSRSQHRQMLAQDEECSRRKHNRMKLKRRKPDTRKKRLKFLLYGPTALLISAGIVMTFGSTIRSLGEGSIFWERQNDFNIAGPIVLGIGVLFLLIAVGIMTHVENKKKQEKTFSERIAPVFAAEMEMVPTKLNRAYNAADKSSIPIMAFEQEEFYAKNVKTKPPDFRKEYVKSNNNYVLGLNIDPINNNSSEMDFTWPDSFKKKYRIDDANPAYSSLPLLGDIEIDKKTDTSPSLSSGESLPLNLSSQDIGELPESFI